MALDLTATTAEVVAISGRKDLETRGLLTGFINEAQDFCYKNSFFSNEGEAKYSVDLAADAFKVEIPYVRIIREVWCTKSDGERWQLEKKPLAWIRREFGEVLYDTSSVADGNPLYYAEAMAKDYSATGESAPSYDDEGVDSDAYTAKILIVMQPPSEVVTITIYGDFLPAALATGTDSSLWTKKYPHILADATWMVIERRMGDKEKADKLEEFVLQRLQLNNFDNLEQSLVDTPISEG